MKLAVPEYQGRVAPVFDCCKRLMIVLQLPMEDELLQSEEWAALPRMSRADRLAELKVELLICGGISCWMEDQVLRRGIRMIPWVVGDVWEVLAALREGRISDPQYAMPGRAGCMGRRLGKKCGRLMNPQKLRQKERKDAQI